jgi:hypothetical protein
LNQSVWLLKSSCSVPEGIRGSHACAIGCAQLHIGIVRTRPCVWPWFGAAVCAHVSSLPCARGVPTGSELGANRCNLAPLTAAERPRACVRSRCECLGVGRRVWGCGINHVRLCTALVISAVSKHKQQSKWCFLLSALFCCSRAG